MLSGIVCDLCGCNQCDVVYKVLFDRKHGDSRPYSVTEKILLPPEIILKCFKCGLVFAVPEKDAEKLLLKYIDMIDEKYTEEELGRRLTARNLLKKLNEFKKYDNRMLEMGCCTGFFLDEARSAGWEVFGVELSRWAAQYADKNLNLKIKNSTLEKANFPSNYFDAVIMQNTIEHLLKPKEMLLEVRRILKPSGVLYINTPDIESLASRILQAKWWGINQFHLYYFSKKTLGKMLEITGFKSIKWSSYSMNFSLSYWVARFRNYNIVIYKILEFFSGISSLRKRLFRVNLRD